MSNYAINQTQVPPSNDSGLVFINHMTYALYLFSFFTAGLTWLIAIIINYIKRGDAQGTWLESHFDWQIKTFWLVILMVVFAIVLPIVGLPAGFEIAGKQTAENNSSLISFGGLLVLADIFFVIFIFCWHLYRIIRGWLALASRKSVP